MSLLLKPNALASRAGRKAFARNAETLRSQLLGLPKRSSRTTARFSAKQNVSGRLLPAGRGPHVGQAWGLGSASGQRAAKRSRSPPGWIWPT